MERGRRGGIASGESRRARSRSARERLRRLADEDEQLWAKLRAAYCDGLDAVLADGSPDVRTRVMTAGAFLAGAYGKPAQTIVGDPEQPVTFVLASLLQLARDEES